MPHLPRLQWFTSLALLVTTLAQARADDFAEWKYRQTLRVDTAWITTFVVPPETLDAARADWGDLRLLDPTGREVAFALRQQTLPAVETVAVKSFRATLRETSTQIIVELQTHPVDSGEVTFDTPAREFLKRARVENSDDGEVWQPMEDGVPLFRQSGVERLDVKAEKKFIRVTLDDTRSPPVPITGAKFTPFGTIAALKTQPLSTRVARHEEFAGETVLTLELGAAHAPLYMLTFVTPERLFTRRVTVGVREFRDEATVERIVTTNSVYKVTAESGNSVAQLSVPLWFTPPSRELIIHIMNGDSPPLAVTGVDVLRHELYGLFDAMTPGDYTLLSGHPQVPAPRYDVALLKLGAGLAGNRLNPGPLTPNPGYRPPETLPGTAILGAAIDPAPWRFRKTIQVAASGVQQLELDLDVLAQAQRGFADLRLVRAGAQVPYLLERPALSRSLTLTARPADDPKRPRTSRWEIALPRAGLPLTRMTLASPTALFQRPLRVFEIIADDRGNRHERILANGNWSHTPDNTRPVTLPLNSPPVTATLFVETDNGDNPPIALGAATAAHAVARLLFKTEADAVALYYGNAQAGAPRYDLALVAGQILSAPKIVATLGAEEKARPDGWAQSALAGAKGGVLFWGVLALVVIALLVIVAKLLPKPPAPSV